MSKMPMMMPLNIPAARAYEAWAARQSYRPISWEELPTEQKQAWREAAESVLNWYDETYDPLDEPTHHE